MPTDHAPATTFRHLPVNVASSPDGADALLGAAPAAFPVEFHAAHPSPSPSGIPAAERLSAKERHAAGIKMSLPETADPRTVRWGVAAVLATTHLLALAAVLPYFFSWSALALLPITFYLVGILGINVCYHRLLTHRSFKAPRWVERALTVLAVCCLEGSPMSWVSTHRQHHKDSDDEPDPHSPLVHFFWSHIGWMVVANPAHDTPEFYRRFVRDLEKDPFQVWLDTGRRWLLVWGAHAAAVFGLGAAAHALFGWGASPVQLGLSWLVWGVFVRTVAVWHITWSVNSLTHLWGYRNYDTGENSRNNWLVGLLAMGEGWHNNHHADQRSAAHGHRWFEFDATYWTIRAMSWLGLAAEIVTPRKKPGA